MKEQRSTIVFCPCGPTTIRNYRPHQVLIGNFGPNFHHSKRNAGAHAAQRARRGARTHQQRSNAAPAAISSSHYHLYHHYTFKVRDPPLPSFATFSFPSCSPALFCSHPPSLLLILFWNNWCYQQIILQTSWKSIPARGSK